MITRTNMQKSRLTVLEWRMVPGQALPDPRFVDDREDFPEPVVTEVLHWLANADRVQKAIIDGPTPQRVELSRDDFHKLVDGGLTRGPVKMTVNYVGTDQLRIAQYHFQHGRIQLVFRDKNKVPLAVYHYLAARCEHRVIVGPQIEIEQVGAL